MFRSPHHLVRERPTDEYLPGVVRFTGADGRAVEFDVEIRTRGHFRHKTCDFPPLSLNFKTAQTDGTLFDQQNKMKLVVHCDSSSRYEQTVLREYLAYRPGERLGRKDLKVERTKVSAIQGDQLNLTSVFQYLIGNSDFSPIAGASYNECCHNYVLFGNDTDPLLSIPYDFDQSGLVDAAAHASLLNTPPRLVHLPHFRVRRQPT